MGDPVEMSVGAALEQIAGQLRGASMLPAGQQLSITRSFATPGFFRLDKVPIAAAAAAAPCSVHHPPHASPATHASQAAN